MKSRRYGRENVLDEIKQVRFRSHSNPLDIIKFAEMKRKSKPPENARRSSRVQQEIGKVIWSWSRPDGFQCEYSSEFNMLLEQLFYHRNADHKRQPYFDHIFGAALVDVHNMTQTNLKTGETFPIHRKVTPPTFLERVFSRTNLERNLCDDMTYYLFGKNKQHEGVGREKEYIAGPDPLAFCDNRIAFTSQCGGKRLNQDNLCVCSTIDGLLCVGVFDGHGPEGHLVSQVAAELALQEIRKLSHILRSTGDLNVEMLHNMFGGIDRGICQHGLVSSLLSGSTASFVLKDGDDYWFSHVGDSSIVLIREEEGQWIAEKISKDHRPSDPSEKERIEDSGGVVRNMSGTARVFLSDWNNRKAEDFFYKETNVAESWGGRSRRFPTAVVSENEAYLLAERKDLLPGLSLSRSLGDELGKHAGISAEPEIFTCQLKPPYLGMLLASDGLWDGFESPQQVVSKLQKHMLVQDMSRRRALQRIAKQARNYFMDRNKSIDDITIVWVALESTGVLN